MMSKVILLYLLLMLGRVENSLDLLYQWKTVDVQYPNEDIKRQALLNKSYIPTSMIPIDLDVEYVSGVQRRIFLTFPRLGLGRAFSVGVITDINNSSSPVKPYPDFDWHDSQDCTKIIDGFRLSIDHCNRLWIMDTGRLAGRNICPPKIFTFDLLTDRLIDLYVLPDSVHRNYSLIMTPLLDIRDDQCEDTFAYISDVVGNMMIVYDQARRTSWRIENKYFFPYPPYGSYNIDGVKFELMDGVFGKALSPVDSNGDRTLFFSALSSVKMGSAPASIVRNQSLFINNPRAAPQNFTILPGQRESQSGPMAIDSRGIIFFGIHTDHSLRCWHHTRPFFKRNMIQVAVDQTLLPFVTGIKIVPNNGTEELWLLTSNFGKIATGTIRSNETNFRIMRANARQLTKGTRCRRSNFEDSEEED